MVCKVGITGLLLDRMSQEQLIREAFLLGFMSLREGFNTECTYDHCAPESLRPHFQSEKSFRFEIAESESFQRLQNEAVEKLAVCH